MKNKINKLKRSFEQNKELCPLFFDKDNNLKSELREKMLEISNDYLSSFDIPEVIPVDIILGGSLANYHWSEYSDVDLHLIFNYKDIGESEKLVEDYLLTKKSEWNLKHDVKLYGFDVEVYGQITPELTSAGIYSILKDKWISFPSKENYDVPIIKIVKKANVFIKLFNNIVKSNSSKEDKLEMIEKVMSKIRNYRKNGLEKRGEYSEENMVFKTLRRTGYLDKVKNYKKNLVDQTLSI